MNDDDIPANTFRLDLEAKARRLAGDALAEGIPPPPYHVHGVDMLYYRCAIDHQAARDLLPPGLEPDDPPTATFVLYTAPKGSIIAPYSAGLVAISVANVETHDGDVASYVVHDFRSGLAWRAFAALYLTTSHEGWGRLDWSGDTVRGEAGDSNGPAIRLQGTRTGNIGEITNLLSVYMAPMPGGGTSIFSVLGRGRYHDLADATVDILRGAPEVLQRLRPQAMVGPLLLEDVAFSFSLPRRFDPAVTGLDRARSSVELLDLFSSMRRPALILGDDGHLLQINHEAERLSGVAFSERWLSAEPILAGIARDVLARKRPATRVAVPRRGGLTPLLGQMLPLGTNLTSTPSVLLLFTDPERADRADASPALRLLGLTPAEARIAALVGGGQAPRRAAAALGITEGTARTTLKLAFDKLGLSRQAELVQLVERLAG